MLKIRDYRHNLLGTLPDNIKPRYSGNFDDSIPQITFSIDKEIFYNGFGVETNIEPYQYLVNENIVEFNDDYFFIKDIQETRSWDNPTQMTVTAMQFGWELRRFTIDGIWGFMPDVETFDDQHIIPTDANTMLSEILTFAPGWQVGDIQVSLNTKRTIKTDWQKCLYAISLMKKSFECIPKYRVSWDDDLNKWNKYVDLIVLDIKTTPKAHFRYDRDMSETQRKIDTSEIVTRMYVYGKDGTSIGSLGDVYRTDNDVTYLAHESGKTYIDDFSYYLNLGYTLEECQENFIFSNKYENDALGIEDVQELYDEAKQSLDENSQPKTSYIVKLKDLHWHDQEKYSEIKLGDNIRVYDKILGLNFVTTIIGLRRNYNNPIEETEIDIENRVYGFENLFKSVVGSLNTISKESLKRDTRYADSVMINNNRGIVVTDGDNNERVVVGKYDLDKYGIRIVDGEIVINKGISQIRINAEEGFIIEKNGIPQFQINENGEISALTTLKLGTRIETDEEGTTDSIATESNLNNLANDLQTQIDGSVSAWFKNTPPYTEDGLGNKTYNEPASTWISIDTANGDTKLRDEHLGDYYYNNDSGKAYEWQLNNEVYDWIQVSDNEIIATISKANSAYNLAENKNRMFYQINEPTSTPAYSLKNGDTWLCPEHVVDTNTIPEAYYVYTNNTWNIQLDYKAYTDAEVQILEDAINLKVSKNDVINQINISTEGVDIDGRKVNITGITTFTNENEESDTIIDGGKIQAESIDATKIKANTITADQVKAQSLTIDKLNIGEGINLLTDNLDSFEHLNNVDFLAGSNYDAVMSTLISVNGNKSLCFRLNDYYASIRFPSVPVEIDQYYIASCYIYSLNTSTTISLSFYDTGYGSIHTIPANTWTRISAKAKASSGNLNIQFKSSTSSNYYYIDCMQLEKVNAEITEPTNWKPSTLTKIDANSVTTGRLQSNNGKTYFDLDNNQFVMGDDNCDVYIDAGNFKMAGKNGFSPKIDLRGTGEDILTDAGSSFYTVQLVSTGVFGLYTVRFDQIAECISAEKHYITDFAFINVSVRETGTNKWWSTTIPGRLFHTSNPTGYQESYFEIKLSSSKWFKFKIYECVLDRFRIDTALADGGFSNIDWIYVTGYGALVTG